MTSPSLWYMARLPMAIASSLQKKTATVQRGFFMDFNPLALLGALS